jgi:hypothetical protein
MKRNLITIGFFLLVCLPTTGCAKKSEPEAEQKPAAPPFQRNEASLAGMVKQERSKIQNDFKNLAIYYQTYETEMGKPPSKWEDFKSYIVRDGPASLVSGIEDGRYVVRWKTKLSSHGVLAYEKQPDVRGRQVVVYGDGHIETIEAEELKKVLENKN